MRHPTRSLSSLKASLRKCRKIGARLPLHDVETDSHELKIRSLILLSHASIEEYLESLSRECAELAVHKLETESLITRPLLSLVTYHKPSIGEKFEPSTSKIFQEAIRYAAQECLQKHKKVVGDNNGIKQSHQNRLFYPVGINCRKASPLLPDLLEAFADKRGSVAHRIGIKIAHTRSSILSDIATLMEEVKLLDKECCKHSRKIVARV